MDKYSLVVTTVRIVAEKPYHPKRPHRKTRTGCSNCKARKVKCDEVRPACRACVARNKTCIYATPLKRVKEQPAALTLPTKRAILAKPPLVEEPLFIPTGRDDIDMRLLWFYTANTWVSYSSGALPFRNVDEILTVNVVQHAFANHFLMNSLLALSAMHLSHCGIPNMGVSRSREFFYRSKAFETYRKAVEAADPPTFPALVACSLLLCGLSTDGFRGEDAKPLYILDWMVLWRGINTIVMVTGLPTLFQAGVAGLIYRPEVDLNASAHHVPPHLLSTVASIEQDDPEFLYVQHYHLTLKYLGSLYLELSNGLSQMLLLRIMTFFTYLPSEFVDAARERHPRALIILAHYLVFAKYSPSHCWWMQDVSNHEIPSICNFLGSKWAHMLRVPTSAVPLTDHVEIARLLLGDPRWEPPLEVGEGTFMAPAPDQDLVVRSAAEGEEMSEDVRAYQERKVQYGVGVFRQSL
ncbi:Sterol regulatory element-binding protein ECM22-like protein 2 [Madurella fahalii]|uniref:Sterol regulatory element-binding protein ECM22-like protein 2 n=1 Tax=Madurella fahalii TaxID=1157608 RepID=A0ABQ0G5N0_9PEZI